jgi:hypothetical protein
MGMGSESNWDKPGNMDLKLLCIVLETAVFPSLSSSVDYLVNAAF